MHHFLGGTKSMLGALQRKLCWGHCRFLPRPPRGFTHRAYCTFRARPILDLFSVCAPVSFTASLSAFRIGRQLS